MDDFFGMDDAAPVGAALRRGRGAVSNRTGRFERDTRVAFNDGWEDAPDDDPPPPLRTKLIADSSRKVIARNTSPDLPFDQSINPYRGCEHGCVYCFARPSHAYLGLSPGIDFETKILVKRDAAAALANELRAPSYACRPIAIGTNTDAYQPAEKDEGVMRGILEVLREHRHPVTVVTKGALVTRDADILGAMGRAGLARVSLSLTTLDHKLSRAMEPRAASPQTRLRAIRTLSRAGCPVGVLIAPIIPAVTDHEIERLLEAAAAAGASGASWIALRLPLEVEGLFEEWLREQMPDRADRVLNRVRELHGGKAYDSAFGRRMTGQGVWSALIRRRFAVAAKRFGLAGKPAALRTDLFQVPARAGDQLALF